MAVYSELNFTQAVNDVKFHPLDHIVAFSSRGDSHKIQVFKYEYNLAEKEAKKYFTLVSKSAQSEASMRDGLVNPEIIQAYIHWYHLNMM